MIVQGFELEDLDTFDADVLEMLENAEEKFMEKRDKALNDESVKLSKRVRLVCEAVAEYIDTLWGVGTAEKIFMGKMNFTKAIQVFDEINDGVHAEIEKQLATLMPIVEKYTPNRAKR